MDRLVGYLHEQLFLDTHINKTYWIYIWTDLMLDTYMDKNSWIHTLTRLIGLMHGQTC